jgi:hypothetical protein
MQIIKNIGRVVVVGIFFTIPALIAFIKILWNKILRRDKNGNK